MKKTKITGGTGTHWHFIFLVKLLTNLMAKNGGDKFAIHFSDKFSEQGGGGVENKFTGYICNRNT